jgi:hypothetical protein
MRMLGDQGMAEELVQDTFVRIWRSAGGFDPGRASPATFVLTLARRAAVDLGRRRAARPLETAPDVMLETAEGDEAYERELLAVDVRDALDALAVAALAVAVYVSTLLGGGQPGSFEAHLLLAAPSSATPVATATVTRTGIGRVISFSTDSLPVLPPGQFYEMWFVGPGDTPSRPNRISAGTFHPDPQGRSDVRFAAAVDPSKYPVVVITRQAGPHDPGPGLEVLRSEP